MKIRPGNIIWLQKEVRERLTDHSLNLELPEHASQKAEPMRLKEIFHLKPDLKAGAVLPDADSINAYGLQLSK